MLQHGDEGADGEEVTPVDRVPAPVPATGLHERRIRLRHPDGLDPAWNPRYPELAFSVDAVSLLMPYAEPYFVRTVRAALPDLDPDLRATADRLLRPGGPPPR